MYSRKSVGPRMEPWGTPALIGYVCVKTPIQNYPKPSIPQKRGNQSFERQDQNLFYRDYKKFEENKFAKDLTHDTKYKKSLL